MFHLNEIFESSPSPAYIKDEFGRIVWANSAYARIHRTDKSDIIKNAKVDFDFAYERDLELFTSEIGKQDVEEFYKLEDGTGAWFLTTKKIISQHNGERFLLSTSSDIGYLKERIESGVDSFTTKEKFIGEINKELDAPIKTMISLIKILKKTYVSKDQKRYLNTLLSIANDVIEVPNDILEYERVESGKLDLENEIVDVPEYVYQLISPLAIKALEHDVSIKFIRPTLRLPFVELKPNSLKLILVRLLTFVLRYSDCKDIIVEIEESEKLEKIILLKFSIKCDKININNEVLNKLFDSKMDFHTAENLIRGDLDIRTYIIKKVIEVEGGKLWLNKTEEQGASFEFLLPFSIKEDSSPILHESELYEPQRKLKILLVDDNESTNVLVKHQTKFWNIDVDSAKDGEEGFRLASENNYDLILMDIEMPKLDGFEAASMIRKNLGPNQNSPVIAFTANKEFVNLEEYRKSSFSDYLIKPYHAFDLFLCISKNVKHYKKRLEASKLSGAADKLYDFSGLGDMAEDAVFIKKMQKLFVDLVPNQLDKLANAIYAQEWETVALTAHSLKSTFGNIKVLKAADAMREIEKNARSKNNLSELNTLLTKAQEITQEVLKIFREELANSE